MMMWREKCTYQQRTPDEFRRNKQSGIYAPANIASEHTAEMKA